ncbi:hypothetical protein BH18THE2_BH18THE2_26060 [soil metagenome]
MSFVSGRDATNLIQPPNQKDYAILYQEIGDYVIQQAHLGDPLFERVFEWAWKKTSLKQKSAGTGYQAIPAAIGIAEGHSTNDIDEQSKI